MNDTKPHFSAGRVFALLFGALFVFLVIINAASDFLSESNPRLALSLNPLNATARINLIALGIDQTPSAEDLSQLQAQAELGINTEPVDSRFYSLLGIINELGDKPGNAQLLYRHSLRLLPTEIQALTRLFNYHTLEGNPKRAIELADIITRRWPNYRKLIAPYFPRLLENDEAYLVALDRFAQYHEGIKIMTSTLLSNPSFHNLAYRMVLDWHESGVDRLQSMINSVTWALFKNEQVKKAYSLFLLTLSGVHKDVSGYIHNGNFITDSTGNAFDWKSVSMTGLQMGIVRLPPRLRSPSAQNERALTINFMDAPVRLSTISQYLTLPPANFSFSLVYSTLNFKGPNPVELVIKCFGGKLLVSQKLQPGMPPRTLLKSNFKVPDNECATQYINFNNGRFVKSWNNRFSGSLFFHKINVMLGGA